MKLLHLIDTVGAGGPYRSLLVFLREAQAAANDIEHKVVALRNEAYPPLLFATRKLNVPVVRAPAQDELNRLIADADVVLIHFWNTPHMWAFLTTDRPPARYVVWSMVLGSHAPQFLSPALLRQAAAVVLTSGESPLPSGLPHEPEIAVVPGLSDFSRVEALHPQTHSGYNVDYIGTCNAGKIHPRFVEMMDRVEIPDMAVRICGGQPDQAMARSIETSRNPSRFRTLGFVEDIRSVLQTSDVFGYPLAETTYATSDISLQEAMFAGIPPIVLPHGGPARFVSNGKTGIVARNEDEFVAAIEYLYRNPEKRLELGRNAAAYARTAFGPASHAARLIRSIRAAASRPRLGIMKEFALRGGDGDCEAECFLVSQGWEPENAFAALLEWRAGIGRELDRTIAALPDEAFQVEGGILHWRNATPQDAALRWWTAIWLLKKRRYADAALEGRAARERGAPAAACDLVEELTSDDVDNARRASLLHDLGLASA